MEILIAVATIVLGACGGGGSSPGGNGSTSQASQITASQIAAFSGAKIEALGADIKYLSDSVLQALTFGTGVNNPVGQIQSITGDQIGALTPAQVRMIGASGPGGSIGTSQIQYLNPIAWAALTANAAQVAAITAAEIATLWDSEISALGANISMLSNAALNALTYGTGNALHSVGQIESITAAQIAALTPAQVRMIGAAGPGGSIATSQIQYLNSGAWAALTANAAQVAAITATEIPTLWDAEIVALGTNINSLSNAALNALTSGTGNALHSVGQIESITVAQINALSPTQVRMIGAAGPGGSVITSQIQALNSGAWAALAGSPAQVAAITAAEMPTLGDSEIVALGTNINMLSNAALSAMTYTTKSTDPNRNVGQIESLTMAQVGALSPAQISAIAGITSNFGPSSAIAILNAGAFASLSSLQVAVLTPANVVGISATSLASLSASAIAGLNPTTAAGLTATQKSLLSTPQHTACHC
jgi:hypothetical protein